MSASLGKKLVNKDYNSNKMNINSYKKNKKNSSYIK
jgi:hypothetical protein